METSINIDMTSHKDQIYSLTKTTRKWTKYMKHVVDIRHQAVKDRRP